MNIHKLAPMGERLTAHGASFPVKHWAIALTVVFEQPEAMDMFSSPVSAFDDRKAHGKQHDNPGKGKQQNTIQ